MGEMTGSFFGFIRIGKEFTSPEELFFKIYPRKQ
jgi:hypothetical protein